MVSYFFRFQGIFKFFYKIDFEPLQGCLADGNRLKRIRTDINRRMFLADGYSSRTDGYFGKIRQRSNRLILPYILSRGEIINISYKI